MIKELVNDAELLSTPCAEATAEDAAIAADLLDTLASLDDAACLAANQIGHAVCVVAYLGDDENAHVMYNPKMSRALRPFKTIEGCLTVEGESKVTRYDKVTVAYQELSGGALVARKREFEGWTAQIIQHMIDHCKGKLV